MISVPIENTDILRFKHVTLKVKVSFRNSVKASYLYSSIKNIPVAFVMEAVYRVAFSRL